MAKKNKKEKFEARAREDAAATEGSLRAEQNGFNATDPFGSYTGVSEDGERPVQDADDL